MQAISKNKPLQRNTQRLSETPIPRRQDVLKQYHQYKKSVSRSSVPSPVYPSSPPILKKARTIQQSPPVYSPYTTSQEVTTRLYRGIRTTSRVNSYMESFYKNSSITTPEKEFQLDFNYQSGELEKLKAFMMSLGYLDNLVFDLEVNFQLVRGTEEQNVRGETIGNFFELQDRLKDFRIMDEFDLPFMQGVLLHYTKIYRSVLRKIRKGGSLDEAILLEMFWRLTIKLFDRSIALHFQETHKAAEAQKNAIQRINAAHKQEIDNLSEKHAQKVDQLQAEIQNLRSNIEEVKLEKENLGQELFKSKVRVAELTESDIQVTALDEMQRIYRRLDKYIKETEGEHQRQLATLDSISNVMELAEKYDEKAKSQPNESQTN